MNLVQIRETIQTRFKALVEDEIPIVTIYDNDVDDRPGADTKWIHLRLRPGRNRLTTVGAHPRNLFRRVGTFVATIHGPLHDGTRDLETIADTVEAAFRSVTVDGLRFYSPSVFDTGRVADQWQIPVSCPWEADHVSS